MRIRGGIQEVFAVVILGILLGASPARAAAPTAATTPSGDSSHETVIVFIGDSLTAGYGVRKEQAFPEVAEGVLKARGHKVHVVNGGVSGSVSAESDRRVEWFLRVKPDILVLELGANDALKGTPPSVIEKNLAAAIRKAQSHGIKVLLLGMRVFENMGADYAKGFSAVYTHLSQEFKLPFVPFLLEGVALKPELNQADGKHPNVEGHKIVAKTVADALEKLL